MSLYMLYLSRSITDTQTRLYIGGAKLLQRGMLIQIGQERMRIVRKHRDGSVTVERGIMGTTTSKAYITDSGVGGDSEGFR